MPVLHDAKEATYKATDYVRFKEGVDRMRKLMLFPSSHFNANEIATLKSMAERLNQIADEFEDEVESSLLEGYEVRGLSGLNASMGGHGNGNEVNRHRLWDGTAYLTELNSDDY